MPNWRKLIVSGSDSHLNSLTVSTFVSASDFSGGNFSGDGSQLTNVEGITKFIVSVEDRGSGNKYIINDQYAPELTFFPGDTYVFDLSDSSNSNHPLAFRLPDDTSYSYNVTQSGSPGSSGAETRIKVDYQTSGSLKYYCTVHGNSMGNLATVIDAYSSVFSGSFSGSFQGDGSNLTFPGTNILSSSAQIASDISGSITEFSASITDRVTELEISGSDTAESASFAARITNNEITGSDHENRLDTLEGKTLLSSSLQIAEDISGSFTLVSESFASERLKNTTDTLTGDLTVTGTITAQEFHTEFVSASIIFSSGSTKFGDTQDDNHNFTGSVNITGSVTAIEFNGIFQGALSSSAQIASDISGAFADDSSSFSTRVTELESFSSSLDLEYVTREEFNLVSGSVDALNAATSSYALSSSISGAFTSLSESFQDRITLNEATGSDHESRLDTLEGKTLLSSSAQIAEDISGSFVEPSSSFSTRVTDLESFSSSLDATFATDADLNLVSASVDGLLAATSSYALSASISGAFTSISSSIASDIEDIIDGTTTVASSSYAFTASYALNAGSTLTISGSDVGGTQVDSSAFTKLQFDSSTGLNVESIDSGTTALVSIGSHFRDIIVDGQTTLVATGSDQLELVSGTGVNITTSTSDTNANSVSKEIAFSVDDTIATTGSNVFVGDQIITGSLITTLGASGSFSGSFEGNGSGLTGVVTSSYALTASYALNAGGGGSTDTGSLLVTASAAGSTITFEKGDGSTFDVLIAASASSADALVTASISGNTLTFEKGDTSTFSLSLPTGGGYSGESATAHHTQSVSSVTWSFNHQLGDRLPAVTVYDSNYDIIIPNTVNAVDDNNLQILFTTARTGYATAVVVGASSSFASTASYIESSNVDGPLGMDTIATASYALTASYGENFTISGSLNINNFVWPSTDGADGQAIVTDGSGVLEFADINLYARVKNISGTTLYKGTPVHATSSAAPPSGNVVEVIAASASNAPTMPGTFVLDEQLANEAEGKALLSGYINGVDTSQFNEGDVVYVGPNGGFTNVKPTGSNLIQNLGIVTKVDASNGSGYVYGSGRSNDVPNILPGYAWVGNSSHVASAVATSSFFVTSGSYAYTASYVEFDNIANKPTLLSGSAQIAEDISGSFTSVSQSFASGRLKNTTDTLDGDLTVTGTVTAQEFHTEFISASIIYESGSTQFGNSSDDTHVFTGSVNVNGSVTATSFTGSFSGILDGAISSSAQIATEISGAFVAPSSSFSTRVTDLESFSSSLDATFATDADLNLVSASVDGLLAATSSYALSSSISGAFNSVSSSIATDISNIIDGTTTVASASNALTASYALNAGAGSGFPFSGSAVITGSLFVSGSTISGSFKGDGSQLTGITFGTLSSIRDTFTDQIQVTVNHNFNTKNVNVAVYDDNDRYIIPDTITLTDNDNVTIDFAVTASGAVVVTQGGHLISGSIPWSQISEIPEGIVSSSSQIASDISGSFTSISSSIASDIEDIIDGTTLVASASNAISALTASYALNAGAGSGFPFSGSAIITGSLLVSGSIVDFTDAIAISGSSFSGSFFGDGTGLSGLGYGDTKKLNQTVAATTWSFSHNMNEQYPAVTVYNDNNEVIQPTKIEGVDAHTLKLYFGIPVAGTAVAVVGGTATTQEAGFNRVLSQTSAATTWSFAHNLGNKYPQVIVYDSNDEFVLPGKVEAVDQNNLNIYFDTAQSGTATATVGGTSLTASYADSLVVTDALLSTQENTDVDTGTETVATVSTTYYDGAFFDYIAKDGTNYRAGTVMAVWDGSSVQYNDNSTADIGDTSGVTLAVDINGTDARLRATTTSDNWNIKAFIRAL